MNARTLKITLLASTLTCAADGDTQMTIRVSDLDAHSVEMTFDYAMQTGALRVTCDEWAAAMLNGVRNGMHLIGIVCNVIDEMHAESDYELPDALFAEGTIAFTF